jgi:hypothetical protein
MRDLPELVVDGPPSEWLPGTHDGSLLTIVRVDGPLPTVTPISDDALMAAMHVLESALHDEGRNPQYHRQLMKRHRAEWPTLWSAIDNLRYVAQPRPLRAGDRVTLATKCKCVDYDDGPYQYAPCFGKGFVPFATATVARVEPRQDYMESSDDLVWLVTVTDVEELA